MPELEKIIQHFDNHTLLTQKRADFELLKQAFAIIQSKEHLTRQGLEKIIAIKAVMNNGLSRPAPQPSPPFLQKGGRRAGDFY